MAKASFNWEDPLLLDSQLAADERQVRNAARTFASDRIALARHDVRERDLTPEGSLHRPDLLDHRSLEAFLRAAGQFGAARYAGRAYGTAVLRRQTRG